MYAIREAFGGGVSTSSRDHLGTSYWDGRQWTPCSDRARTYDTPEEADAALADCPSPGVVVDLDV